MWVASPAAAAPRAGCASPIRCVSARLAFMWSPRLRLRLPGRAAPHPSGVYPLGSPSAAPHPSVPRQPVERFEGVVAPGGRDSLDHADLVHERGELDEPRGRDGVPKTRLIHDL